MCPRVNDFHEPAEAEKAYQVQSSVLATTEYSNGVLVLAYVPRHEHILRTRTMQIADNRKRAMVHNLTFLAERPFSTGVLVSTSSLACRVDLSSNHHGLFRGSQCCSGLGAEELQHHVAFIFHEETQL